jgi:spore coat protein CotF
MIALLRGAATCMATNSATPAVREVDLPRLQQLLLQQGAILKT